jgi:SP family arabinose:H+ symporter-like MFS transporter
MNINQRTLYLLRISLVATLGGVLFGYDTAVISGTVDFLQERFAIGNMMLGLVVSSAIAGCMLGAAFAGSLSDRFGRRVAFAVAALCFLASAIGTALPRTVEELIVFRLLGGIGVGIAAVVSPMYIAEVSPEKIRGRLVSLNQIAILSGMVVIYSINSFIAGRFDHDWNVLYGWRWMFGSEAVPALLFFLLVLAIPESPRWLLKAGREDDCLRVLGKINDPARARQIREEIREALRQEEGGWHEVFGPVYRPVLVLGTLLAIIQHGTGINAVMYYAPRIFTHAGVENSSAIGHMVMISLIMLFFTAVGLLLVDKVGRKPLLLISTAGMAVSLVALFFDYSTTGENAFQEYRVLFWVIAYVASFSVAMGPIVWVLISEIFPNRVRGRCASVAVFFMWSASLLISQFFPSLLASIGEGVFLLFGVLSLISLVYIWWAVPETKGQTLEQIEQGWIDRAKLRHPTTEQQPLP